jgi:hypothetical protein
MTSKDIIKLKLIAALLEAIDVEDEDDAKGAVATIKTLLGTSDK